MTLFYGRFYRIDNEILTIYAILDSELAVRYVGKTRAALSERARNHIAASKKDTRPISQWIAANANDFMMQPLELSLYRDASNVEYSWIRKFRRDGCDLLNIVPYQALEEMERAA